MILRLEPFSTREHHSKVDQSVSAYDSIVSTLLTEYTIDSLGGSFRTTYVGRSRVQSIHTSILSVAAATMFPLYLTTLNPSAQDYIYCTGKGHGRTYRNHSVVRYFSTLSDRVVSNEWWRERSPMGGQESLRRHTLIESTDQRLTNFRKKRTMPI